MFVLGSAVALAAAAVDTAPRGELESVAQRVIELGGRVRTRDVNEWWRLDRGPDAFLEGNRFALGALKTDYDPARRDRGPDRASRRGGRPPARR